jgi:hypothetical protein
MNEGSVWVRLTIDEVEYLLAEVETAVPVWDEDTSIAPIYQQEKVATLKRIRDKLTQTLYWRSKYRRG